MNTRSNDVTTDISTLDSQGRMTNQIMGSSAGYSDYLAGYAAAEDKAQFNADYCAGNFK